MSAEYVFYFLLLAVTAGISLWNFRDLSKADRMISVLLVITVAEEVISYVVSVHYKNNLLVYHLYSPVEFFLLSLYFNYSLTTFRKSGIGFMIGFGGIAFSIINTLFIQKVNGINSFFLLFEGTVIILCCLLSFHQILLDEEHMPYRFTHFWVTICLILYWGITFTGWGIYASTYNQKFVLNVMFAHLLKASNYLFYSGLAIIFLCYKKLIPSGTNA